MTPRRVLLATRSAGKLREWRALVRDAGWELVDLDAAGVPATAEEDAIEVYDTFEENALAKARYFHARCGGLPVMADDSGLEVAALGGAPGVHSKRWSARPDLSGVALDEANNSQLMQRMQGVMDRRARYVCVAVYVDATREVVVRGEVPGRIAEFRHGGSGGFGYDPYFESAELGRAFSEVEACEKAAVSHRGRAVRALLSAVAAGG